MKQLVWLACFVIVCSLCSPASLRAEDATPPTSTSAEPKTPEGVDVKRHPIKAGEHLYKILRSYGVPEKNLSKAYHATVRLNPHIQDFEHLGPGQILFVPTEFIPASTARPVKPLPKDSKETTPATPQSTATAPKPTTITRVPEPMAIPEAPTQSQEQPASDGSKKPDPQTLTKPASPLTKEKPTAGTATKEATSLSEQKKEIAPVATDQPKPLDIPTKEYIVQPGDRIGKILREQAKIPEDRIFNEGLEIFFRLNPQIKNKNTLETGQLVYLPIPAGESPSKKSPTSPKSQKPLPPTSAKTVEPKVEGPVSKPPTPLPNEPKPTSQPPAVAEPPSSTELKPQPAAPKEPAGPERPINAEDRKAFLLAVLDKIGFSVLAGEDIIFPVTGNDWFRVNLRRTPIIRTPWGEQIVLLPSQYQNQEAQFLNQMKIPVVVPDDWDPAKILRLIEARSKGFFKLWTPGRPLILNRDGITIDLNAALIIRVQEQRFYVMNLISGEAQPVPSLLKLLLAKYDIALMDWMRSRNAPPQLVDPPAPNREDLLVPWIERANAGKELGLRLGPKARNAFPEAKDLDAIILALEGQGFAKRDALRLAWFQGEEREIALTFSAMQINDGQTRLVLLDWDQASPNMVALLAMQGFGCLAVK